MSVQWNHRSVVVQVHILLLFISVFIFIKSNCNPREGDFCCLPWRAHPVCEVFSVPANLCSRNGSCHAIFLCRQQRECNLSLLLLASLQKFKSFFSEFLDHCVGWWASLEAVARTAVHTGRFLSVASQRSDRVGQWPVVLNVQLVSLVSFPSGLQVHSQYLKVVNS